MTEKKWERACPSCGSKQCDTGAAASSDSGSILWLDMSCWTCGAEWEETHELSKPEIEVLCAGEPPEEGEYGSLPGDG